MLGERIEISQINFICYIREARIWEKSHNCWPLSRQVVWSSTSANLTVWQTRMDFYDNLLSAFIISRHTSYFICMHSGIEWNEPNSGNASCKLSLSLMPWLMFFRALLTSWLFIGGVSKGNCGDVEGCTSSFTLSLAGKINKRYVLHDLLIRTQREKEKSTLAKIGNE